jgi:hypothetical protein
MAHAARFPDRVGPTRPPPPSLLRCHRSLSCWMRLDLKPSIKRVPLRVAKEAPPKHRNTKQKLGRSKIGEENSSGVLPVWSPSPPTTQPSSPWWRGSSPPLDYGFVAVAICISFNAIWAALHDYGHLCITFMMDLSMSNIWDCNHPLISVYE